MHNYCALLWACECLLEAACDEAAGLRHDIEVRNKIEKAVRRAIMLQLELLEKVELSRPKGNLAFILSEGLEEGAFKMAKKLTKLDGQDGIVWKDDICLRAAPLVRFVRQQPGFQSYTTNKIARELYDMGALVTQEEGTYQVHLGNR